MKLPVEAGGMAEYQMRSRMFVAQRICLVCLLYMFGFLCTACGTAPIPFNGQILHAGEEKEGHWQTLKPENVTAIFGIGLSYAKHIEETGEDWKPDEPPPVFRKSLGSLNRGVVVAYPSRQDFLDMADSVEHGLGSVLEKRFTTIDPLVDYEVELGVVLLERFDRDRAADPDYMPRIGFVLAGDFTSRTFMILGQGQPDPFLYWGAAKSFSGFAAVGERMWVPQAPLPDAMMQVLLETRVNDEIRQQGYSSDRVYSARQMLNFVAQAFPEEQLLPGTVVMTGTPAGVAFNVPSWKRMLVELFGFDRLTLMEMVMEGQESNTDFLKKGDTVTYFAYPFGSMSFLVE